MAKAFYQSVQYEPLRDRKVRRRPLPDAVTFSSAHPAARDAILDYFDEMSVERVGILHGEYVVHPCGVVVADRTGLLIDVCMSRTHGALPDRQAGVAAAKGACGFAIPSSRTTP